MTATLQELFVSSRGAPVSLCGVTVVQMDQVTIPNKACVSLKFVGPRIYKDNAAILSIPKPGIIIMSNGEAVNAVQTWDEDDLPRVICYDVVSGGKKLQVYNKYRTRHKDFVTEDSFTGNA